MANGHVKLVGIVDSEANKDAPNITANGVSGVFSVDEQSTRPERIVMIRPWPPHMIPAVRAVYREGTDTASPPPRVGLLVFPESVGVPPQRNRLLLPFVPGCRMSKRKGPKTLQQVRAATLADVKRVMAKPRVASSARWGRKSTL